MAGEGAHSFRLPGLLSGASLLPWHCLCRGGRLSRLSFGGQAGGLGCTWILALTEDSEMKPDRLVPERQADERCGPLHSSASLGLPPALCWHTSATKSRSGDPGHKRPALFQRSWDLAFQEFQLQGQGSWVSTAPAILLLLGVCALSPAPSPTLLLGHNTHQGLTEAGVKPSSVFEVFGI